MLIVVMSTNLQFYHNPDAFDPEHFSPENVRARSPWSYIPFSAGWFFWADRLLLHLALIF